MRSDQDKAGSGRGAMWVCTGKRARSGCRASRAPVERLIERVHGAFTARSPRSAMSRASRVRLAEGLFSAGFDVCLGGLALARGERPLVTERILQLAVA